MQPHESGPRKKATRRNPKHSEEPKKLKRMTEEEIVAEAEAIIAQTRYVESQAREVLFPISICGGENCPDMATPGFRTACLNGHRLHCAEVSEPLYRMATAHLN